MSVRTQIDRITDEVSDQRELIQQIHTAIIGKTNAGGGVIPTGTKSITANGTYDVMSYANAEVDVPVGIFPSGTKSITTNDTHDVTEYESVKVNVPVGVFPSGTKAITANGTHDVTNYSNVSVTVPDITVKRKEATVYPNGTGATITVGFKPDVVVFTDLKAGYPEWTETDGYQSAVDAPACVVFSEMSPTDYVEIHCYGKTYDGTGRYTNHRLVLTRTEQGFMLRLWSITNPDDYTKSPVNANALTYVAIKYT